MRTKRTIGYSILILIIGIFLGWAIFGSSNHNGHAHEEGVNEAQIWTCSMDPQVRQNEPGKCPLCGMDLIPLENMDTGGSPNTVVMGKDAVRLANISTITIGFQDAKKELRLNGKVQVDERKVYAQTTHIPGRIEQLTINFTGETVSRGQQLAQVYSPDLMTAQEELLQAFRIKESQPELYEAAKQKLRNWRISESSIQKIISTQKPIQRFSITADVSGVVTEKKANLGDYVDRGIALYEIADLSSVWVLFDVYEADMAWVKKGDKVNYTIASLPGESFEGVVSFVDPFINPETRVATARVEVKNTNGMLKPEMFATGLVIPKQAYIQESQVIVPKSAVLWTGERSVIYVKKEVDEMMHFELREVTLGASLGENYVVKNGLQLGEEVVVNGTFTVDAAAQLAGKPSMMNHEQLPLPVNAEDVSFVEVSKDAKKAMQQVITDYLILKDALVSADKLVAQKQLGLLMNDFEKVGMQLPGSVWEPYKIAFTEVLKSMGSKDLEAIRKLFKPLSQSMIAMVQQFSLIVMLFMSNIVLCLREIRGEVG